MLTLAHCTTTAVLTAALVAALGELIQTVLYLMNEQPNHSGKPNTGLTRIIKAGGYSMLGIKAAFRHEAAFRQEIVLSVIFIPLAFFVANGPVERIVLIGLTVLVLVVELLNSAIEALVDRVGTEHHELSGRAKDMGSAAVLLSLLIWVYAWLDIAIN